jgi:hypothetical protein
VSSVCPPTPPRPFPCGFAVPLRPMRRTNDRNWLGMRQVCGGGEEGVWGQRSADRWGRGAFRMLNDTCLQQWMDETHQCARPNGHDGQCICLCGATK